MGEQKATDWLDAYPELEDFYYEDLITGVVSRMKSRCPSTLRSLRERAADGVHRRL
jgi:hypothetical protein